MSRRTIALWLSCLTLALCAPVARAEGASQSRPVIFSGNVAALADGDLGLFIGTFDDGLYLRDGAGKLARIDDPAVYRSINALAYAEAARVLWVGTQRGLARCAFNGTRSCRRVAGARAIHALVLLADGNVLAGGDGGLAFVAASGTEQRVVDHKHGAPFRAVWSLAQGGDGTLFVGTSNGLFFGSVAEFSAQPSAELAPGPFGRRAKPAKIALRRAAIVTGDLEDDWVTALAFAGASLHVGTYNAGVASFDWQGGRLTRTRSNSTLGYVNIGGLSALAAGDAAVATMAGLYVGGAGGWRSVATPDQDVTAVARSKAESSVNHEYWIGTRGGVVRRAFD